MKKIILALFLVAISASVLVIYLYIDKFNIGYFSSAEKWGSLGDFFGGVLNPFFTFLSIVLLAYTLTQNKKALEQSKEALKLNHIELGISSKALQSSSQAQHLQVINTTFFNMLTLHNNIVNDLYIDMNWLIPWLESSVGSSSRLNLHTAKARRCGKNKKGREVLEELSDVIIILGDRFDNYSKSSGESYKKFSKESNILGHYFRHIFQIIKFIDSDSDKQHSMSQEAHEKNYIKQQKRNLIEILIAQLSSGEIELLCLHYISDINDGRQFSKLLIKYEMLKHIQLESLDNKLVRFISGLKISNDEFKTLFSSNGESLKTAFGDNSRAHEIYEKITRQQN